MHLTVELRRVRTDIEALGRAAFAEQPSQADFDRLVDTVVASSQHTPNISYLVSESLPIENLGLAVLSVVDPMARLHGPNILYRLVSCHVLNLGQSMARVVTLT